MAQLLHTYTKLICHIHNSHKSQLSHYTCDKKMLVVCVRVCVCVLTVLSNIRFAPQTEK